MGGFSFTDDRAANISVYQHSSALYGLLTNQFIIFAAMRKPGILHSITTRIALLVVYAAFLVAQLSFNVEKAGSISSHFFFTAPKEHNKDKKVAGHKNFTQSGEHNSKFRLNKRFHPEKSIGILVSGAPVELPSFEAASFSFCDYNTPLLQQCLLIKTLRGPPVVA